MKKKIFSYKSRVKNMLIENAFNFDLFGHEGFEFISSKLPHLLLLEATYSDVDELRNILESEVNN